MARREQGTVKWFNNRKGFGFIECDSAESSGDVFVHYNQIRGKGFRTLNEGERVAFNLIQSDKGLQAEDVEACAEVLEEAVE